MLPSCVPCDVETVGARREAAVKVWTGLALLVGDNGAATALQAVDNEVATAFEIVDNGVFAAALEFVDNGVPVALEVVDNGVSAALDSEVDDNRVAAALEVSGWLDVGVHIHTYIHTYMVYLKAGYKNWQHQRPDANLHWLLKNLHSIK